MELPPKRPTKEVEVLMEAGRHLDKFLCQGDQRTDLFNSEVPLISILDEWSKNPYPMSAKIAADRGMNTSGRVHKIQILEGFLSNFKKFRVARERKGRTEDKQVMLGYMSMLADALHDKEKVPGYLK